MSYDVRREVTIDALEASIKNVYFLIEQLQNTSHSTDEIPLLIAWRQLRAAFDVYMVKKGNR